MIETRGSLLLTGVYGVGKSTVAAEMATMFEEAGIAHAAIDLDWLGWFDAQWDDDRAEFELMIRNLQAVVGNYVDAGVRYIVMALSIEHAWELQLIRSVAPEPLHVVRLETTIEVIRSRLSADPTSGRTTDLAWAAKWLESGAGLGSRTSGLPATDRCLT